VRTTTEPAVGGAADGEVADITQMLSEYYALRGWDDSGVPLPATLARLGL
jgi:aldehyde:ferredoxin oxidoreductase